MTESLHYLRCCVQRVKKVVSDSPGLVDLAISFLGELGPKFVGFALVLLILKLH